ncbi:carboxylesterase/lipase family protein [Rhodococcus sp. HNM0569]|uniref:carboxylesterase/lipase family protein n=1 Tax=Rhodococcus sp. HNM0569 TaxID=2716340 RepID=UPI003211CCAD
MSNDHTARDPLEVATATGVVRGIRDGGVFAWRGVPYAAPPVALLRLRAPEPHASWTGVRDASSFGPAAPQPRDPGDEDCLTLDIVRPPTSAPARPVMVFVHGGGYSGGNCSAPMYRGHSLALRGDVVYVSIGYRLGALGYLDFTEFATPERRFDSNLGLRDQVAALEWIQRNIAAFGGDPDNVTVFGESAGANAVTTLLATPAAKGLFARAIAQSSPVASSYPRTRTARWAREFVRLTGARDAASWLEDAPASEFVRVGETLVHRGVDAEPGTRAFAPVVDGDFLPEHPLDVLEAGRAHPVPLIIGTNAHEGRAFPRFADILPTTQERIDGMFAHVPDAVKSAAISAYPAYPKPRGAADLGGDVTFWEPSVRAAAGHSGRAETFTYRYDFAPRLLHLAGLGATHATELYTVFGHRPWWFPLLTSFGGRRGARATTDLVQTHWVHFARHGTPAPGPHAGGVDWPRYDTAERATLILDAQPRVERDPDATKRRAWIGYEHIR